MPNIGGALKQVSADMGEVVVKPVSDEVGRAIEQGVQSVVSGPKALDPAVQQKKQQEEEKKRQWALRTIEWNKNIQASQQKVRQEEQQTVLQKKQEEQKEEQKIHQLEVVKKQQRQQQIAVIQAQTKTEKKSGVGG